MSTLANELRDTWRSGRSMDDILSRFVVETKSRASGCWRLEQDRLNLIGFGWASDMPDEVSRGFQEATRSVTLDQTGLGIVKAAVTNKPAIGRRNANESGLDGSASWIARFEANTSLAVPIRDAKSRAVVGVFAVSTADFVEEGDRLWQTMQNLANELGLWAPGDARL